LPSLAERVEALEQRNAALLRRCVLLQWAGMAAVLGLVVLGAVPWVLGAVAGGRLGAGAQGNRAQTVAATRFVVTDAHGTTRAELGMIEGEDVGLRLQQNDKVRCEIRLGSNGVPTLTCYDEGGKEQLTVTGGTDAGLNIYDKRGDVRVQLSVADGGASTFALRAKDLKTKIQLGVNAQDLPFVDFSDGKDQNVPLFSKEGQPLFVRSGQ
jgi:hypothetical protein